MLTPQQKRVLEFLRQELATGVSPSYTEIGRALGIVSKSNVHRLLSALEERGFIRRMHNRERAIELTVRGAERPPCYLTRPLLGRIPLRFIPILPAQGTQPERAAF